jgi:FG-GAP repeat
MYNCPSRILLREMMTPQKSMILTATTIALLGVARPTRAATLIDLATEPADISIFGEGSIDNLGTSAAVGDIDGDGIEDLLVVACNTHPLNGTRTGTLYILWGSHLGQTSAVDLASQTAGISRIFGRPGDDDLYCNVSTGDFNHDGYDDIVLASPAAGQQYSWEGKDYLIFGRPDFPDTLDLFMQPPGVVTAYGDSVNAFLGGGNATGDIDGDGYDDIVLSAKYLTYAQVFIIHGRDVFPPVIHTQQPQPGLTRIIDSESNRGTGAAIACRDVNGDGCDDVLLGAPGNGANTWDGRTVLVYGTPVLPDTVLLANPSVPVKRIFPDGPNGDLGVAVAIADLDGDGREDLITSAPYADFPGCEDCGEVYVIYDADSVPDTLNLGSTTIPMTRLLGSGQTTRSAQNTHFGFRILRADLSGDSICDLIVSNAPFYRRATTTIVYGRTFMPSTIQLPIDDGAITRIKENTEGDKLGYTIAALDIDGDSVDDLVLGAPYASPLGRSYAGIVYALFSNALVTRVGAPAPHFALSNRPNPFSEQTMITVNMRSAGPLDLSIFDVTGRRVAHRVYSRHGKTLEIQWDGRDDEGTLLSTGVYFCRATATDGTETRKLVVVR